MRCSYSRSVATSKDADTRLAPCPVYQGVSSHIINDTTSGPDSRLLLTPLYQSFPDNIYGLIIDASRFHHWHSLSSGNWNPFRWHPSPRWEAGLFTQWLAPICAFLLWKLNSRRAHSSSPISAPNVQCYYWQ